MKTVNFHHFPLHSGERVLDLGCGEGRHTIAIYVEGQVQSVGVDLALDDLQQAQEKFTDFCGEQHADDSRHFNLLCANGLTLPFADGSFDKVICSEVLEHVPDYQGVLDEINRVLRDDGLLCVSVPRRWPEKICWWLSREYHEVPGGHIRIFRDSELHQDVSSRGFKRYSRHWAHSLHVPYWWLKCLFWRTQDNNWLIRQYHRLLVWDLLQRPALTRNLERILDPIMGKSVVMYFRKDKSS